MASRAHPSLSKVQFLLHLRECHTWAAQACRKNSGKVSDLFHLGCTQDSCKTKPLHTQGCVDDLAYLARELNKLVKQIDDLQDVITNQVELFDKRRNRTIGMFIAIYVPLAFATVRPSSTVRVLLLTPTVFFWHEHRRPISINELDQHHIVRVHVDS
jgi:hypothetical protein